MKLNIICSILEEKLFVGDLEYAFKIANGKLPNYPPLHNNDAAVNYLYIPTDTQLWTNVSFVMSDTLGEELSTNHNR